MNKLRKGLYDTRSVGALYSAATVFVVFASLIFSIMLAGIGFTRPQEGESYPDWYLYLSFILPQAAFALAGALFFVFTDAKPREVYRAPKLRYILLAILLQFGLFSISLLNELFLAFL